MDFVNAQYKLQEKFFGADAALPTETASSGNGGSASAAANGGAVAAGDINSGGNAGSAIAVGDSVGNVMVDGGSISNTTNLNVGANGGTAIADASGGDYNVAFVS